MNYEPLKMIRSWNRTILNFYWIVVGFIIISAQITSYFMDKVRSWVLGGFIDPTLLTMGIALISILLIVELLFHYTHRMFDYVLIIVGFVIAIIIMLVAGRIVNGLQIALEIPIMVSMFYFNSKKLWFAGIVTLIGFIVLFTLVAVLREQVSLYDLIAIIGMITLTSVIGHAIRIRGMDLLQSLERAVSTRKELFVDTINLEFASKQDYLTGLYNHITFHEYLDSLIQQHETNGLPLQLAIVDIDNFKQINDTFGHFHGDEVLRKLSSLLNASISSDDDFVARYGGEEFTLILTGKSPDQSKRIVEGIRESIANVGYPELGHRTITVSIGMTEYVKGLGKDSLFQKADALLYQAKHQGKNMTMSDFDKESTNGH
jgi:diguanylate cyclase (GGDEF)-like protein